MNSTSRMVLTIVGAAAAGAIIGLLLAPEKGTDLRRRLADTAGDWSSQLNKLIESGKAQLDNLKQTAVNEAENLADEGTNTARGERM